MVPPDAFTRTSRFQASYTNNLPASSRVMFPAASTVGVVAPPIAVISFCAFAVRVCVAPSVVTPFQLPNES